jgi:GntR family transcriptional regulator of gluconate operon
LLSGSTTEIVERADLWEIVAARLRLAIISREFAPGEHLRELPLAQRFGVSRVPVREALIRLAHEGLVRGEPRRGAFVVGMSLADVREVYDVRTLLEVRASRLAAKSATSENIGNLRRIIKEFNREAKKGNSEVLAAVDIAFHREIVMSAHHRRLTATWEPLSGIIQTILMITNEHSTKARIMSAHRPLVDAIATGDAAAAEKATLESHAEGMRCAELVWPE